MADGRCPECGHDTRVIGHEPRCPVGGIIPRGPVLSAGNGCGPACYAQHNAQLPDHVRPAAQLTARKRRWFR